MKKPIDRLRLVLAGSLGSLAWSATVVVLARLTREPWLAFAASGELPHGRVLAAFVAAMLTTFLLAWVYATWFDHLLDGAAILRGLKFGAISWAWIAAIAALIHTSGAIQLPTRPVPLVVCAALSLSPMLALGAVVGLIYGAGRCYAPYLHGLGYGLPDRRSLG